MQSSKLGRVPVPPLGYPFIHWVLDKSSKQHGVSVAHLYVRDILGIQIIQVPSRFDIPDHDSGACAGVVALNIRLVDPATGMLT